MNTEWPGIEAGESTQPAEMEVNANLSICIITQQLGKIISGPGLIAHNLVDRLVKAGHQVTVIGPEDQRPAGGLSCQFTPVARPLFANNQARWISLSFSFGKALRILEETRHFDVVHFIDGREAFFCPARAPRVGTLNDTYSAQVEPLAYYRRIYSDGLVRWMYYQVVHLAEGWVLPRLQALLANSSYTARVMAHHYRLDADRLEVCYLGVDPQFFRPALDLRAALPPHPPRILFVGGNMQRKGLPDLIRAATLVRKAWPACEFWVVGADPNQPAMAALCRDQGVADAFIFLGGKSQVELVDLYAQVDVFCMPSLTEAFGLVFLEAMAAEVPVVATAVGGIPEVINDGQNGLLVPPQNPPALADALLTLLNDPVQQARFRLAGLETVRRFSVERMVENTCRIYKKAMRQTVNGRRQNQP